MQSVESSLGEYNSGQTQVYPKSDTALSKHIWLHCAISVHGLKSEKRIMILQLSIKLKECHKTQ